MKLELKDLPAKITPIFEKLRQYAVFIGILLVLSAYGFIVLQIRHFANVEPTDIEIAQKLKDLKAPKIDETAVNKIQKLEGENIEVKTLFDHARDNPFQE